MLSEVKWGEFRIGDLFEKIYTKKLRYKADELPKYRTREYTLPCLTSSFYNQGLNYYVPKEGVTILKDVISIPSNSDVYRAYLQTEEFTVLSDAYAIRWKNNDKQPTQQQYLFLVQCINKITDLPIYSYKNKLGGWNVVQNKHIQLPIKLDGEIDLDFMGDFVAELEAQRIAELEAYLTVTGLKDCTITEEEKKALCTFDKLDFRPFKVVDLFNVKNTGNILSKDIIANSGDIPYLCASAENNAVSTYVSYDKKFIEHGNVIFIGGKTFVVTYQEKDFLSNDSHNLILSLKDETKRQKLIQLYMATCIKQSLGFKYSWGDSISNRKIQTDVIFVPQINSQPDYATMQRFISAIQKLVIKDVVSYADKKIAAAKEVVKKN